MPTYAQLIHYLQQERNGWEQLGQAMIWRKLIAGRVCLISVENKDSEQPVADSLWQRWVEKAPELQKIQADGPKVEIGIKPKQEVDMQARPVFVPGSRKKAALFETQMPKATAKIPLKPEPPAAKPPQDRLAASIEALVVTVNPAALSAGLEREEHVPASMSEQDQLASLPDEKTEAGEEASMPSTTVQAPVPQMSKREQPVQQQRAGMVVTIDGMKFDTLEGFIQQAGIPMLLIEDWRGDISDFAATLETGFLGVKPGEPFTFVWMNWEKSHRDLGYPETIRQLQKRLDDAPLLQRGAIKKELKRANASQGSTVFDWILSIFSMYPHITLEMP